MDRGTHATIDQHVGAAEEARGVRQQERGDGGELVGAAEPPEQDRSRSTFMNGLLANLLGVVGYRSARPEIEQILPPAARTDGLAANEAVDASLGPHVSHPRVLDAGAQRIVDPVEESARRAGSSSAASAACASEVQRISAIDAKHTIAVPAVTQGRSASASITVPTRSTRKTRLRQSAMVGECPSVGHGAQRAQLADAFKPGQAVGVGDVEDEWSHRGAARGRQLGRRSSGCRLVEIDQQQSVDPRSDTPGAGQAHSSTGSGGDPDGCHAALLPPPREAAEIGGPALRTAATRPPATGT